MRIAQVAPLIERVPPRSYGGTERVVHALTETLVSQGHDVTLFATGDSDTQADLVSVLDRPLREQGEDHNQHLWHVRQLAEVLRLADRFDVIHFHLDFLHFPLCRMLETPTVSTLHGRLDTREIGEVLAEYNDVPLVSISNSQREPVPFAAWQRTVYNGMAARDFEFESRPGAWLAFLGRFAPEKGPVEAIEIARRTGIPLKMAAKIDARDRDYFETQVRPAIDGKLVEYIGEVDLAGKNELLGGAIGLLFPITWPEPFGLVMIESMACGTPVLAYRRGSVPEVVKDHVSGFIADDLEQAVQAAGRLDQIDRSGCRRYCEEYFSIERMTEGYVAVYEQLLATPTRKSRGWSHAPAPSVPAAMNGHSAVVPVAAPAPGVIAHGRPVY